MIIVVSVVVILAAIAVVAVIPVFVLIIYVRQRKGKDLLVKVRRLSDIELFTTFLNQSLS